ncbi:hypothetical protein [Alcaligenes faecalis]|uniref:hypothetical protein n=1 Tax=Alcaligenes faecalis TaxID=511 RepID=UPI000E181032|nr:hypothetical protein [Alcaligenes faecalis]UUO10306.1 hypothetical protein M6D76_14890 [Alcaligenes faecalis]SSY79181.1 Uncharacterised protein [Alcaligenes faecalis subsp. faecalis]
MSKTTFHLITSTFWLVVVLLVVMDSLQDYPYRPEPAPIAWGSGQAASGGHCSGR